MVLEFPGGTVRLAVRLLPLVGRPHGRVRRGGEWPAQPSCVVARTHRPWTCSVWSRAWPSVVPEAFTAHSRVLASPQRPESRLQRPRCSGLGAQPASGQAQRPRSPLLVGSTAGATSDLKMARDRAGVLLHADRCPGSAAAAKVGGALSQPAPASFPHRVPSEHALHPQVHEERGAHRDALRGLPLLRESQGRGRRQQEHRRRLQSCQEGPAHPDEAGRKCPGPRGGRRAAQTLVLTSGRGWGAWGTPPLVVQTRAPPRMLRSRRSQLGPCDMHIFVSPLTLYRGDTECGAAACQNETPDTAVCPVRCRPVPAGGHSPGPSVL